MSRFIDEGDRSQGTLLPERIDEYVSDENPVRVVDAFVAELDLARLGFTEWIPRTRAGRPTIRRRCSRSTSTAT
jgi:transposase